MPEHIVVLSTCGSEGEAAHIAQHLVESRLAACVNILPPVRSVYRWQGKIERASEWMLLIKTASSRFGEVAEAIHSLHSYELPEVIGFPIVSGSPAYLKWIGDSLHE